MPTDPLSPRVPVIDVVSAQLAELPQTHRATISAAADVLADRIARGGLVHVFGAGHSHLLAEELFFRAGGLLIFNAILDSGLMLHDSVLAGAEIERLPGYGQILLSKHDIHPSDAFLVISYSGINTVPIEVALEAKRRDLPVIALTSVKASQACASRHAGGKHLYEVADLVLDNPGPVGDAVLTVPGLGAPICALSTIIGATLLQWLVYEITQRLVAQGVAPPVIVSANSPSGDTANAALLSRRARRMRHL